MLAGVEYWATPGGKLEAGESYENAAIRELYEETGIHVRSVGESVAYKEFLWEMPDGEMVIAVEKYFLVISRDESVSIKRWTTNEKKFTSEYKWLSESDLRCLSVDVWPSDLLDILKRVGAF